VKLHKINKNTICFKGAIYLLVLPLNVIQKEKDMPHFPNKMLKIWINFFFYFSLILVKYIKLHAYLHSCFTSMLLR
jgi:hypothetical protein